MAPLRAADIREGGGGWVDADYQALFPLVRDAFLAEGQFAHLGNAHVLPANAGNWVAADVGEQVVWYAIALQLNLLRAQRVGGPKTSGQLRAFCSRVDRGTITGGGEMSDRHGGCVGRLAQRRGRRLPGGEEPTQRWERRRRRRRRRRCVKPAMWRRPRCEARPLSQVSNHSMETLKTSAARHGPVHSEPSIGVFLTPPNPTRACGLMRSSKIIGVETTP